MAKPVYYLWRDAYCSQKEYEAAKMKYAEMGFRVVTFIGGKKKGGIQEGMRALIRNHTEESS